MGIIGFVILISLIIWLVFGWDYMVGMWDSFFNWIGDMGQTILNDTGKDILP